jgi:hypothetical protein
VGTRTGSVAGQLDHASDPSRGLEEDLQAQSIRWSRPVRRGAASGGEQRAALKELGRSNAIIVPGIGLTRPGKNETNVG